MCTRCGSSMLTSLPGTPTLDTDPTVSVLWVLMLQWSSSLDGYTPFGARLLLIHCSVILRVLGVPAEDLGFESPLCRLPLIPDIVADICKGACPGKAGWFQHQCCWFRTSLYAIRSQRHLYDRWRISLEEKGRCRDTWRRNPPITSSIVTAHAAGG